MIVAILSPTSSFSLLVFISVKEAISIRQIVSSKPLEDTAFSLILTWPSQSIASLLFVIVISPGNNFPSWFFFLWSIEITTQNAKPISGSCQRMIDAGEQVYFNRRMPFLTSWQFLCVTTRSDVNVVEIYLSP